MTQIIVHCCIGAIALGVVQPACGAERPDPKRWEADIAKFEAAEQLSPVPKNGILFVGSSSIRMWNLQQAFADLPAINRGFGGSHLADSVHYADRLIIKHQPQIIVLYAGDNDINNGLTAAQVAEDYQRFVTIIRQSLPETRIVYVPIKPSLARWEKYPTMSAANRSIRAQINQDPKQTYFDIEPAMLDSAGQPRADLFLEDGLHLNDRGYAIWSQKLRPVLERLLASPTSAQSR